MQKDELWLLLAGAGILLAIILFLLLLLLFRKRRRREHKSESRSRKRRKQEQGLKDRSWKRRGQEHRPEDRNRRTGSKSGAGSVSGDTADMPAMSHIYLEHYGFRVLEEITYIHTKERITQGEAENGMDDQ